jgi:hypothetical protein
MFTSMFNFSIFRLSFNLLVQLQRKRPRYVRDGRFWMVSRSNTEESVSFNVKLISELRDFGTSLKTSSISGERSRSLEDFSTSEYKYDMMFRLKLFTNGLKFSMYRKYCILFPINMQIYWLYCPSSSSKGFIVSSDV